MEHRLVCIIPSFVIRQKTTIRLKKVKLAVRLSQNIEEQKVQQIKVNVRTAYLRHHEALQQVEALKLSVKQAEENYRIMQNRYLNQLAILTDLLDANSVRLNAELQLTSAVPGLFILIINWNAPADACNSQT